MRASEIIKLVFDKWAERIRHEGNATVESWGRFKFARSTIEFLVREFGDIEIDVKHVPPKDGSDRNST